jgi:hypothetical protein
MENEARKIKEYQLTTAGREWVFTPEAADALGGAVGLTIFAVAVGSTLKSGTTEVSYKGWGLFLVNRHGKRVKVSRIKKEGA